MSNYYCSKFRVAFESLEIAQEQFVKEFNDYYISLSSKVKLTQPKLSRILTGKSFVPIDLVHFMCKKYGFNPKFFTGEHNSMTLLKTEVKEVIQDTKSIWQRFKDLFNFKIFNK